MLLREKKRKAMSDSFERIVPTKVSAEDKFESASLHLHYERYRFASGYLKAGRILDIACGVGYGSYYLVSASPDIIEEILAVDISQDAIDFAVKHYAHQKISYRVADAMNFSDTGKFSTIISLETIE